MAHPPTTVIIGAGIAGLVSALHVASNRRLVVVEGEPVSFGHSSGRNAAILRPLETSVCISELVLRSAMLLNELGAPSSLFDRRGLVLTATGTGSALLPLSSSARDVALPHQMLTREELWRLQPALRGGTSEHGIHLPNSGVLDISALDEWLRDALRARGGELRTRARVMEITRDAKRVRGVVFDDGEQLNAEQIVIAAGAWSDALGAGCGCPLPLRPHRRHLMLYGGVPTVSGPVAWDVESNVYFRPHLGLQRSAILACPGDETPHVACLPEVDPGLVQNFPQRLAQFAPALAPNGERSLALERAWACLRTTTPDAHPVVGADPRLEGLFWLAGLGGVGISAGLACGEHLGRTLLGGAPPSELDPARWLPEAEGNSELPSGPVEDPSRGARARV